VRIADRDRTPEPASAQPPASEAKQVRRIAGQPEVFKQDEAAVSSFAARLTDRQTALDLEEGAKVERLKSAYQTGAYTVDSASVSRAIVNDCLGFGPVLS
jgi:anti-sigma28 factor (negative regulator of flagellin synthesis)